TSQNRVFLAQLSRPVTKVHTRASQRFPVLPMSLSQAVSSLPPELRVDLTDLAEDLLALHCDEVVSLGCTGGSAESGPEHSSSTGTQLSGNQPIVADLIRRVNKARVNLQRAQEVARKLTACDLDLEAQEKLLLAMSTSCITKRQLVCLLKRELLKFFKDTSTYFDSP
ncbi:hypothetical protein CRM22_007787, partial [Opisthorchis felineus]